jgi:hypothetical protein
MRLVAHSTLESDLRKRIRSAQHEDLGTVYSPCVDIDERTLTETLPELAKEVTDTEVHHVGEVSNAEAARDI